MSSPDIASILRDNIDKIPPVSAHHWNVANHIMDCRTEKLGGHILKCDHCGHKINLYNSCRDRHCPQCQSLAKVKWLKQRKQELIPVQYFHVVFTVPDILNPVFLCNPRTMYNLLFQSVKETLLEMAGNPDNIGADIGFISILHTWGQNLNLHPHIHCIVPGGGFDQEKSWVNCKRNFFMSVIKLSAKFRGKFLALLSQLYTAKELSFSGKYEPLSSSRNFKTLIDKLYKKSWVVFSKETVQKPESILDYLGKYVYRIAISNDRILSLKDGKVFFRWKDYKHESKKKTMSLDIAEFIRRFLLHVLPPRFVKVRFCGLLANRNKKDTMQLLHEMMICQDKAGPEDSEEPDTWEEVFLEATGIDMTLCPECRKGHFLKDKIILPGGRVYDLPVGFDSS
jgi:hypothetical protein